MHRFITVVVMALAETGSLVGAQSGLESRVDLELGRIFFDGAPPIAERLALLGDPEVISGIVLELARRYSTASAPSHEYTVFRTGVFALGKLNARVALPFLRSLADTRADDVRGIAVQSIGQIDARGNQDLLLSWLHSPDFTHRMIAAQGLANTNDPAMLTELEVQAAREPELGTSKRIQEYAETLRQRINAKVKLK